MATRKKTKTKAKKTKKKTLAGKSARKQAVRKPAAKKAAAKKVIKTKAKKKPKAKPKTAPKAARAAARPAPAPAAPVTRPAPAPVAPATPPLGERIGIITHYYTHLSVAIIQLESGSLREGDVVRIKGHTSDFTQRVESMEVDHVHVSEVHAGQSAGVRVKEHAREHDVVYKVR